MNTRAIIPTLVALALAATFTPALRAAENIRGVSLDFVTVGNPGNAADTTTVKTTSAGAVAYTYDIGKYEITADQWTSFLNLVDPTGTNAYSLFATNMENNTAGMRINNNGTTSGQHYAVTSGYSGTKPVVYTNWQMAARFCNYLTTGNTETGPYTTASGTAEWTVDRATAEAAYPAVFVLPTLDEWYKAAYHTGTGLTGADYWDYPNQADVISTTMANYGNLLATTTDAGSYPYASAYGTYDQGGNVREWLETPFDATRYLVRGGSWDRPNDSELKANGIAYQVPTGNGPNLGFRIVRIVSATTFNPQTYGATGNGTTLDTAGIQGAINAASTAGGGTVYFASGTYKTSALTLKANVTLNLASGAQILASPSSADWPGHETKPLMRGDTQANITIKGSGEINCSGGAFYTTSGTKISGNCPKTTISLESCNNLTITGITIRDSCQSDLIISKCNNVTIDGISIYNPDYATRRWTDGIDVDRCAYVTVKNCYIETADDAICMKSSGTTGNIPTHDVLVQNCTLGTTTNAAKFGTDTFVEMYNITYDGITVIRHPHATNSSGNLGVNASPIAAISLETMDGSNIHDITFSNFLIEETSVPIFAVLANRSGTMGAINNATFKNIFVKKGWKANQVNCAQTYNIGKMTFNNIMCNSAETFSGTIPTVPYPVAGATSEARSFGTMPAYGLFARNVTDLRFEGRYMAFYYKATGTNTRQQTVFDNCTFTNAVSGTGNYVDDSFDAQSTGVKPMIWELAQSGSATCTIAEFPSSSNKSIKINDASATDSAAAKRYFPEQTGTITSETDLYASSTSQLNYLKLKYEDFNGATDGLWIELNGGSLKTKNSDGTGTTIQAVSANTWYTVKVMANVATNTFNVYVNGTLELSNQPFKAATTKLNCLECGSDPTGTGAFYVDNVKVY